MNSIMMGVGSVLIFANAPSALSGDVWSLGAIVVLSIAVGATLCNIVSGN